MPPSASPRRHDLDALRVFACYLLFLFHVGMVFNPAPFFHVRNGETDRALRGIPMDVTEADYVAITGPTGSGKSTLLNLIGTL